jgi:ATP dependent DNA ligase C terminal region/ATP dependent DNA ligase domain
MNLLQRSRLDIKLGEYAIGTSVALNDPMILSRTQEYRRQAASRMAPLEVADIRKRLPAADYHVSLKVDGEFDVLVYADGEVATVNPGGTVRVGLPFMKEAADLFKKAGIKKALIAGELHYVRPDGKRPRVHDITRVARQPASLAELDGLRFTAFDIIEIDGAAPPAAFEQTWKRLCDIFGKGKLCNVVEAVWLKDSADVEKQFNKWVERGEEGAVVRSDAAGTYKIKPRHSIDAVVIGFTEGTEDRHGMVHDLLVALMRADGSLHVLGHVGGGFNEAERRSFLSDLKDMVVKSDYVEVNDQVAYHMVRPEWVIEISVLDLISQSTRGTAVTKMALHWNAAEKRYQIIRRLPLVNMISPQYIRRRDDKSVNPTDLRLQQVSDLVEVALVDRDARQLDLSKSQILQREVYTKQLKGQTMVRKLVMWQTNKDRESDDFPAFVIHFTDYSPNRKTQLERDIRVSNSKEQIDQLWEELLEENIAKGWVRVGAPAPEAVKTAVASADQPVPATKKKGKSNKTEGTEEAATPEAAGIDPVETAAPKKKTAARKKKDE